MRCWPIFLFLIFIPSRGHLFSQHISFFTPADTLDKHRFWISAGGGTLAYTGVMAGLVQAWYADTKRTPFHTFDDWGEWQQMDKYGHVITAYQESRWLTQGARWTGMNRRRALWLGTGSAFLLQSSVEILDGFSAKWGFSWWDMAFNTAGCGLFAAQDILWNEQRISIKTSSFPVRYPEDVITSSDGLFQTTLSERAQQLYGNNWATQYLKDYNARTFWLSVNPASFCPQKPDWLPAWINVAVGVGAENMFEGYGYSWEDDKSGAHYHRDQNAYPRRSSVYLSWDVDLTRIHVRHPFWRSVLHGLNFIKIPGPALEFRSDGLFKGHWMYF